MTGKQKGYQITKKKERVEDREPHFCCAKHY